MDTEILKRADAASDKDMDCIELSRDVEELGHVIKHLGGSMDEQVRAAMCAERVLDLKGIEQSGSGYWRDGEFLAAVDGGDD